MRKGQDQRAMVGPHVNLHYERDFPYPVDVAYAWLTDYQDDDPSRAGAIVKKRDVVRREHDEKGRLREAEFDGVLETFGHRGAGQAIVRLWPDEKRWVAELAKGKWIYEYQLVPTKTGSRILIDYRMGSSRFKRRVQYFLAKPKLRKEIDKMWDGFAAAMAREIKQ